MINVFVIVNYGLVLIYGAALSVSFAGGCTNKKERNTAIAAFLLILVVQTACFYLIGLKTTQKLYPLITHLPLVLVLTKGFKRPLGVALTSVMTAYFCCQLPRWFGTVILLIFESKLAYLAGYSLSLLPFFLLLRRTLASALYQAVTYSKRTQILFGIVPLVYYIFDYATTVYTRVLYEGIRAFSEFLPVVMALFYVVYITVYHKEMQKINRLEQDNLLLTFQSQQTKNEIATLRQTQQQAANYRHDLRHHISLIRSLPEAGQMEKTMEYLAQVQADVERIMPPHICENETANLLFSSFAEKAKQRNIHLAIQAELPQELLIPDTELCTVLSNGLENALHAVDAVEDDTLRKVFVHCCIERNMFLLEIENAYTGVVQMKDDLPVSKENGHGYGCRSMRFIAEKRNGFCIFKASDGIFTLRIVLPMSETNTKHEKR